MENNVKQIKKSDISMFYTNKNDASNQSNAKTANQGVLEDVLEVSFDENGIGLVKNRGVAVGWVNKDQLSSEILEVSEVEPTVVPDESTKAPEQTVEEKIEVLEEVPTPVEEPKEEPTNDNPAFLVNNVDQKDITMDTDLLMSLQRPSKVGFGEGTVGDALQGYDLMNKYNEEVHSKKQATDTAKASIGVITTGNRQYKILEDAAYNKEPGTISKSDYQLLIAVIAGEGSNSRSDMLAVACTVLNRVEIKGPGTSIRDVLEEGYFPFGKSYIPYQPGGKYYATDWGQEKLRNAESVLKDAICGVRNVNPDVIYYSGDGTHNYFSDKL